MIAMKTGIKKCFKCELEKPLEEFSKRRSSTDGRGSYCKQCDNERCRKYKRNNRKKISENRAKYYRLNKDHENERNKKWQSNNKDKVKKISSRWRQNNPKKAKETCKKWCINNPDKCRNKAARYRAKKLNATLNGYDAEIKEIYKNCPDGYHVDHIVPLRHSRVCGLHVPWNLQYLTAEENLKKVIH